jgi:DNA-binding transcriptional ArsR family regulator
LGSPEHRLTWPALQRQLASPDAASARARATSLRSHLQSANAAALLRIGASGISLAARRFVVLRPSQAIPAHQERILAHLAAHPGSRAMDLMRVVQAPRRTLLRHLHALRSGGLVLIVGGGREARYWAI